MEIAPGVRSTEWINLELDVAESEDWLKAIQIFRERIAKRYLLPARRLIEIDEPRPAESRTYGFSIMAVCCLLVETLQSFVEGVPDTSHQSKYLVKRFLTSHPEFAPPFNEDLACHFYYHVRCGILHIGETQSDALIWSVGPLVVTHKDSIRINRTEFHSCLDRFVERYVSELADAENTKLRANFRKKMDFVARKHAA